MVEPIAAIAGRGLLGGHRLCVQGSQHDRYGRLIGEVLAGPVDVNREMVRAGGAWAYRQYLYDPALLAIEAEARAAHRGLWSLPTAETVAPWDYRKAARAFGAAVPSSQPLMAAAPPGRPRPASCQAEPRCRQMSSCAEARQWLALCGSDGIDGDQDGIPCERICTPQPSRRGDHPVP